MEFHPCKDCGIEMEVVKDFGIKPRGEKRKRYRVRRFHCEFCDITETIFADGFADENRHRLVTNKNK